MAHRAVIVRQLSKKEVERSLIRFNSVSELPYQSPAADCTVRVSYSCLNYKDGLVLSGKPGVAKQFPLVPGIDFAGTVLDDPSGKFTVGESVVLTGGYAGQHQDGGYSTLAKVRSDWLVKLPPFLSEREAMVVGTAGFTAMQCVMHLEKLGGLTRGDEKPVLVTGASGGVGSTAVAILSALGYKVVASTGRKDALEAYLRTLGATKVIGRLEPSKPLAAEAWAGVVDTVGGETLAAALASTSYGRAVAACGLAGSPSLPTTVLPFILRGVKLLGVDSVQAPAEERAAVWHALGTSLPKESLEAMVSVHSLEEAAGELGPRILAGDIKGQCFSNGTTPCFSQNPYPFFF